LRSIAAAVSPLPRQTVSLRTLTSRDSKPSTTKNRRSVAVSTPNSTKELYMNDISPNKIDIVCHCSGTTQKQIKALIHDGVTSLDGISRMTGACSGCGACDVAVLELLAENIIDHDA